MMTQSKSQFKALKALHRLTVSGLITLMIAQPVLAQSQPIVVHPDATGGAHIVAAPNGVSVVNIATPNAQGLSHNTYEQFNVTPQGAILNNTAGVSSQTQLGGVVSGNPNLTSAPAHVILNEVVSGNSSTLAGVVEVAGQSADVIIANPNGITCNGCGFIHTPRVTLTTGTPDISSDGNLDGFTVDQGLVAFGVDGANLSTVSLFDIVTRQATFDGVVTGQQVRIAVGLNEFNYATGIVKALENDDPSSAPTFSIDSTAVGGLYADRIALISTEQGVAVRAPAEMSATAGAMSVTADGRLVIGQAQAQGPITVSSAQSTVQIETSLFSDDSVSLQGVSAQLSDNATLAATGNLTVNAQTITLGSGAIVAAGMDMAGDLVGSGELSVTAETLTGTSARIASAANATITADQIALTGVNTEVLTIGGNLTVQTPSFNLTGSTGQVGGNFTLTSPTALELTGGEIGVGGLLALQSADALTSSADFQVAGSASFTSSDSAQNTGDVTATGAIAFNIADALTNAGIVQSAATIDLDVTGDLANTGTFSAAQRLEVEAANIDNQGSIGSIGADLAITTPGDVVNTGLLYGGTDIALAFDGTLTNADADILAEQGITIGGHVEARAGDIINRSANIEAILGSIFIEAASVENSQPTPTLISDVTVQTRAATAAEFAATGLTRSRYTGSSTHTVTTTRMRIDPDTDAPARILAGSDMQIDADSIINDYSQIAANGDMTLNAETVTNTGRDVIETVQTTIAARYSQRVCARRVFGICIKRETRYFTRNSTETQSATIGAVFASIQVGGDLDLNATEDGFVSSQAIRTGVVNQIGLSSGGRAPATPPSVVAINPNVILNRQGLFELTNDPDASFLVETRPEIINPGAFLSSDHLINQIDGLDPNTLERRFGDAYVEAQLVEEQLFALTGQQQASNPDELSALIAGLYDNAAIAAQQLNLTVGTPLSDDDMAALTDTIIWLEEQVVDGQVVLVPRVYLGTNTLGDVQLASAQIVAESIDTDTGNLFVSGRIEATDRILITSRNDVRSTGGQIVTSNGGATVIAEGDIAFISAEIAGIDVRLDAERVTIATAITRIQDQQSHIDRTQTIGSIDAQGNLHIAADTDIISAGGQFNADGNITLDANGDIIVRSIVREVQNEIQIRDGRISTFSRDHDFAAIGAGGTVTVDAGQALRLEGVELSAGGDALLQAENDVTITSVQDVFSDDFELDIQTGGLFGNDTYIREQVQSVETRQTTLDAQGDLEIRSQSGDVELSALDIQSGGQTIISAEQGGLSILTSEDSRFERDQHREEDLFWWNESDEGFNETTRTLTRIEAGGGLQIIVGEEIIAEYVATGDFTTGIAQLAQNPGLEWMAQLQEMDNVSWQLAQTSFEEWDYQSQGLTEAGALLVSVVVSLVVGPGIDVLVSGIMAGVAGGGAISAAMGAALEAGLTSLATQTSISLINNQGDLGAVLSELGSADSLRGLVTAMVSAGLTSGITTGLGNAGLLNQVGGVPEAALIDRVTYQVQRQAIVASVNTALDVVVLGEDLDEALVSNLRTSAASVVGTVAAQSIGVAAYDGDIDRATQLIAHAALGCATGAIGSGDCSSGAIGAFAGELTALIYSDVAQANPELVGENVERWKDNGVSLAQLAGGLAAAMAGGSANVGGNAGANAAENNALFLAIIPIVIAALEATDKALTAYDLYQLGEALHACELEVQGACDSASGLAQEVAINAGIEFTVGSLVPGSRVGAELISWVRRNADTDTLRALDDVATSNVDGATRIVPGGGLQAHETAGGHLIQRHVGQTDADLIARLEAQPNISAASSFPSRATAENAVSSALDDNAIRINDFLSGNQNRLVLDHDAGSVVGSVVQRGSTTPVSSTSVRVVLQRDASMPMGYRIVTGFPTP